MIGTVSQRQRVIVDAERLLDRIQDDNIAEVLEAAAPGSWAVIVEAADMLEDALATAHDTEYEAAIGLPRRDQFAMAAMQGLLSHNGAVGLSDSEVAGISVDLGDALIAALDADGGA